MRNAREGPDDSATASEDRRELALDGSEVQLLLRTPAASIVHCTLPAEAASRATRNLGINEIWIVTGGRGELVRWRYDTEERVALYVGVQVFIPEGVSFQFRSINNEPLTFLCVTIPPWPGPHANQFVFSQKWEPTGILAEPPQ